jgi:hypothetical protein
MRPVVTLRIGGAWPIAQLVDELCDRLEAAEIVEVRMVCGDGPQTIEMDGEPQVVRLVEDAYALVLARRELEGIEAGTGFYDGGIEDD